MPPATARYDRIPSRAPWKLRTLPAEAFMRCQFGMGSPSSMGREVGAGDREPSAHTESNARTQHGHFQPGVAVVVAREQVRGPQRVGVQGAGRWDAVSLKAVAAPVLHRSEQAGFQDFNRRAPQLTASMSASNSPASTRSWISR